MKTGYFSQITAAALAVMFLPVSAHADVDFVESGNSLILFKGEPYPNCPYDLEPLDLSLDDAWSEESSEVVCSYAEASFSFNTARVTFYRKSGAYRNAKSALSRYLETEGFLTSDLFKDERISEMCDLQIEAVTNADRYSAEVYTDEQKIRNTSEAACGVFLDNRSSKAEKKSKVSLRLDNVVSAQELDDWIVIVSILIDSSEIGMEETTAASMILHAQQMDQPDWLKSILSPFVDAY
ncbi:MAG: hypothetical protein CMK07_08260 [Ponticaulis sp.]|nr:hypothetical protein [Ponticaulis sp.]